MSDFFENLERQLVEAARERPERLRRARTRRVAAAGAVTALLVAGGAAAAVGVGGGGREAAPTGHGATTTTAIERRTTAQAAVPRRQRFAIAVLNGTTIAGLGRGVANALVARGFAVRVVTNAADQTVQRTRVAFRDGHEEDAALVHAALFPGRSSGDLWRPTPSQSALAGTEPDVIVIVGEDLLRGRSAP